MVSAVIHGIVLAFGLILPLGVQNVFVFNQGAEQPTFFRALPVVITAALCDTLLIALLTFGVLFLGYMGWVTWKSKPNLKETGEQNLSAKKQIMFALSVSLLNPHAILDTIGVIGTSSLPYSGLSKLGFTLACTGVSWLWFVSLAFAGRLVGNISNSKNLIIILNKISAIII